MAQETGPIHIDGDAERKPRLTRPDDYSDTEWAILQVVRDPLAVTRLADILRGDVTPSPEEATLLLEVVVGVERRQLTQLRKLRESLAPKVKGHRVVLSTLASLREQLFDIATES